MHDALILEEREEELEEQEELEELEIGLESLADKYGMDEIMDALSRLNNKD
jgi:benzoyl-CoA reductase subunit BamC